jgi:hypothetical protein
VADAHCPGSHCASTGKICVDGDFAGLACVDDATCCVGGIGCPTGACQAPTPGTSTPTATHTRNPALVTPTPTRPASTASPVATVAPGGPPRLASAIDAATTDILLDGDAGGLRDFCGTIQVDQERMGYTRRVGSTLTDVARGVDDTQAVAHARGALVTGVDPTVARQCVLIDQGSGAGCSLQAHGGGGAWLLLLGIAVAARTGRLRRHR